jgi:hypothetical protein
MFQIAYFIPTSLAILHSDDASNELNALPQRELATGVGPSVAPRYCNLTCGAQEHLVRPRCSLKLRAPSRYARAVEE